MALRDLVSQLAKLSIANTRTGFVISSCASSIRWFTSSPALSRNLDSHAIPPYMYPSSKNNRWTVLKSFKERYEYTVKPLPFPRTGGRGPNGRIWNHRRAGGHKRNYRMIDWSRDSGATETEPLVEKIDRICYDPNRSARIALVASGERKRYVIATHNMTAGMYIRSSKLLTRSPVKPVDGDAYPLGSLPIGTLISCVEKVPGEGGLLARAAGVTALLLRKQDNECIVRLPSKREIVVSSQCIATVGRVSNVDHNKRVIGKAGRNRWLGFKPRSGRWHRKTGRSGRKIRPLPPPRVYTAEEAGETQKKKTIKLRELMFSKSPVPGIHYHLRF